MNQPGLLPAQITQFNQPTGNKAKNDSANKDKKKNDPANKDKKKNDSANKDKAKNDPANKAKNNDKSNKSSNNSNKSSNNSNNSNNLENFIPKLDKRYLPFWILILLANVFIIWNYIITPIRFSEDKVEGVVTYNDLYYYLHIILLILVFLYAYGLRERFSLLIGDSTMIICGLVSILVLGIFAINIASQPPVKEDGVFKTAPKIIYKTKTKQSIIVAILLCLLLAIIGYDIYKRRNNPLGLLPYKNLKNLYGIALLLSVCVVCYLLFNSVRYNISKYNLPKMWRN